MTFGEFRKRSASEASLLQERGVGYGDRVVLIMPQGVAGMAAFAGAMTIGAVPAFLAYPNFKIEPSKYRAGLSGVTANLRAKAVMVDANFPDELLGHIALASDQTLIRGTKDVSLGAGAKTLHPGGDGQALAFIQHSAGTTGLQKGVALTHTAVLRQLDYLAGSLKLDADRDRIYSWLPLYHDMGLITAFLLPMVYHVPVVMQSPIDWVMQPESALQIISDCECTLAWMPNFAFQFIPRRTPRPRWNDYDLSSLRMLINCSEPVRSTSMKEFENAFSSIGLRRQALQAAYALAENVFAVTQSQLEPVEIWAEARSFRTENKIVPIDKQDGAISFVSSGRLLPGHQIRIVSEEGDALNDGYAGEILLKSEHLFTGYYNRPDLTEESVVDGWYHTGDLGFLWEKELFVVGRKKDLLIVGGENFYPQDIEEIVTLHPAIHDGRAVALGIFDPEVGTESIVVIAEVEKEAMLSSSGEIEREIRASIVESLGLAVRSLYLKPPKWIVKSTAGKPSRSGTREKLMRELEAHPRLLEKQTL